jgi:osmotically-inducible protein OsmY
MLSMAGVCLSRKVLVSSFVVLIFGALLTACAHTDPSIQVAVDSQLTVDATTAPLNIDVSVSRGVVHLSGEVTSREQSKRAVELTRSVRGVKDVVDEMHLSDAVIAATVKRMLAEDPLVGKIPIDVVSTNGHTVLSSAQTSKEDRTRAIEIATKVDGVTHVEDGMR